MKKLLLIAAALFLTFSVSAQKRNVVYLKNGSVIKGTTEIFESKIRVTTKDGSILVYDLSEVERMGTEEKAPVFDFKTPVDKKWNFGVSAGYLYSSNLWTMTEGTGSGAQTISARIKGKHGFTAGLIGDYRMAEGFGIDFGIKFAMSGFKYQDKSSWTVDVTRYTVDIPVLATFYMGMQRKWYVQAGVNASVTAGGKITASKQLAMDDMSIGNTLSRINCGVILGGGYGPVGIQLIGGLTPSYSKTYRNFLDNALINKHTKMNGMLGVSVSYNHKF